jgi:oxygen-independent coproporphyrinogen-3 oxidase
MSSPLALYIHWPWCVSKCPYCDFNSHVAERVDQGRWSQALLAEMDHFESETSGREIGSIFFGGGTPSLMSEDTLGRLIDGALARWPAGPDLEISLEANPSSVEAGRFRAYRSAGVNRLSLGVQSFDDDALAFLGRAHDGQSARQAIAIAAETFPRFSFDLIYARPGQKEADWRAELGEALEYRSDHLSVYQLTIEPGTRFHKDKVPAAPDGRAIRLFEVTDGLLGEAGLTAYEVSNHARPGQECRHNLTYWQGGDYLGIGPGAHGRVAGATGTSAIRQIAPPDGWLSAVETKGHGTVHREVLDPGARRDELVLMGLRLTQGIERERFLRHSGMTLEAAFEAGRLERLIEGQFLTLDEVGLRTTPAGRLRLNAVIGSLLA